MAGKYVINMDPAKNTFVHGGLNESMLVIFT